MNKLLTLCIIRKDGQVLLGMKKVGFGTGRWNGFGGKVEEGESIKEAAIREVKEEADVAVKNVEEVAVLVFEFVGNPQLLEVHVFLAEDFEGSPAESEEMAPKWFAENEIPYDGMWPDDKLWLPQILAGKKLRAKFVLGENDTVLKQHIEEL